MAKVTDQKRVQLFLDCVEQYSADIKLYPVSNSVRIFGPNDPQELANRKVRIDWLRKFTAKQDNVYLPEVAKSLDSLSGRKTPTLSKDVKALLEEAMAGDGQFGMPDGTRVDASDVVRDELYGGRLHGDLDKFERTSQRGKLVLAVANWSWLANVEHLALSLARDIQGFVEDGTITL